MPLRPRPLAQALAHAVLLTATTLACSHLASAQIMTTVAGGAVPVAGSALATTLAEVTASAPDGQGGFYVAAQGANQVYHVDASGNLTVTAGTSIAGSAGIGGPAAQAQIYGPLSLALDGAGNLYIGCQDFTIRKVDASGKITLFAGTGVSGDGGDNGPATQAQLYLPSLLAADANGNVFVGTNTALGGANYEVRKIDANGTITTFAGSATSTDYLSNGVSATSVGLQSVSSLTVDTAGNLYIADSITQVLRKVDTSGIITTAAGNGQAPPETFVPGLATSIGVAPEFVAADGHGDLYIVQNSPSTNVFGELIKIDASGQASLLNLNLAEPLRSMSGLGPHFWMFSIAADSAGNLFLAGDSNVVKYGSAGLVIVAGTGKSYTGESVPATNALLPIPDSIAADGHGYFELLDGFGLYHRISPDGIIGAGIDGQGATQIAYDSSGDLYAASGLGLTEYPPNAIFTNILQWGVRNPKITAIYPTAIALKSDGSTIIADSNRHQIVLVAQDGTLTTLAGTGTRGYSGDGGAAVDAELGDVTALAYDATNDVIYLTDTSNYRLRKIDAQGKVSTVAGTGAYGDSGDEGPATAASLTPSGVAVDPQGNVYVGDWDHHRIRKIDSAGVIHAFAGTGVAGATDGLPALQAQLTAPSKLLFSAGNLYFLDQPNGRVREVILQPPTTLSAKSLTFAAQDPGSASAPQTVTLSNTAGTVLHLQIQSSGDFSETDNCGAALSVQATCTVNIAFHPQQSGPRSGTVTIADSHLGWTQTLALTGTANSAAVAQISPTSLTFPAGNVGSSGTPQIVTVSNTGNQPLTVREIATTGDFAQTSNCSTVAPGSSCAFSVNFTPTAAGARSGTLTISDNSANSPHTVALSGTGAAFAVATNTPTLSATAGGTASATLSVNSAGGFSGTVNFTCAVAYQGQGTAAAPPTCALSPAQLTLGANGTATTTLTMATTGHSALLGPHGSTHRGGFAWYAGGGTLAMFGLVFGLPGDKRRKGVLCSLLVCGVALTANGCGGGSNAASPATPTTPQVATTTPGSYAVTVTAASGTVRTTSTYTFVVTN